MLRHEWYLLHTGVAMTLLKLYSLLSTGIQQLNGTSWKGSHLRVERAKESFLERLNRERAARQQEENKAGLERLNDNTPNTVSDVEETKEYFKEHCAFSEKQSSKVSDSKHSNKRKDCNAHENWKNINLHSNDQVSHTDPHSVPSKREKKKKRDEVEEKMLSSFRNFSSVWADSDNENDEDCQAGHGKHNQEQQVGESIKLDCVRLYFVWLTFQVFYYLWSFT